MKLLLHKSSWIKFEPLKHPSKRFDTSRRVRRIGIGSFPFFDHDTPVSLVDSSLGYRPLITLVGTICT